MTISCLYPILVKWAPKLVQDSVSLFFYFRSSTLVWLVLELVVIYLTLTVMSIHSHLNKWDIVSFSTYKYVGMICVLLAGLLSASKLVYYAALAYVSAALAFFLLRTLKLRIEPEVRTIYHFLMVIPQK